jgi:hypothetical protein
VASYELGVQGVALAADPDAGHNLFCREVPHWYVSAEKIPIYFVDA